MEKIKYLLECLAFWHQTHFFSLSILKLNNVLSSVSSSRVILKKTHTQTHTPQITYQTFISGVQFKRAHTRTNICTYTRIGSSTNEQFIGGCGGEGTETLKSK